MMFGLFSATLPRETKVTAENRGFKTGTDGRLVITDADEEMEMKRRGTKRHADKDMEEDDDSDEFSDAFNTTKVCFSLHIVLYIVHM